MQVGLHQAGRLFVRRLRKQQRRQNNQEEVVPIVCCPLRPDFNPVGFRFKNRQSARSSTKIRRAPPPGKTPSILCFSLKPFFKQKTMDGSLLAGTWAISRATPSWLKM